MSEAEIWFNYGEPRAVPNKTRQYVLTNEQVGFVASLVTTVNEIFSFQIPGPFYIDQREEAIIYHLIDFIIRAPALNSPVASDQGRLQVDLQYSDKEPAATWDGVGEDVEDENTQAMWYGPFIIGRNGWSSAADTSAPEAVFVPDNVNRCCHMYSPDRDGMDSFIPITVVLTNQSFSRDLDDGVADAASFTQFERFSMRCWFTTRNLTQKEKDLMATSYYGLIPFA